MIQIEYNTQKDKINIAEYGRNIQNLLLLANTFEDRAYRTAYVEEVLEMMYLLDPQVKIVEDYKNKLWSHAFKITEYQLDVDVPQGITVATSEQDDFFHKRPAPLPYPRKATKHRHYGSHLARMIEQALVMPKDQKRDEFILLIATFMKMAQNNYNREGVSDDQIRKDLFTLSEGRLLLDEDMKIKDILSGKNTQLPPSLSKTALKNQPKGNIVDKEKQEQAKRMMANAKNQPQTKAANPVPKAPPLIHQSQPQAAINEEVNENNEEVKKKRRRGGVKHKKNK